MIHINKKSRNIKELLEKVNKKKYAKLLVKNLPRVISSEKDYSQMMDTVTGLMMRHLTLSPEEDELLQLLVRLVANYEETHFTMHRAQLTPLDMLEHMMESHNHTAKDLWDIIGDKGTVSKILKGHRAISKSQAKRLSAFYHVSPALFI